MRVSEQIFKELRYEIKKKIDAEKKCDKTDTYDEQHCDHSLKIEAFESVERILDRVQKKWVR